jgi:predicted outer membrane lipoprotein
MAAVFEPQLQAALQAGVPAEAAAAAWQQRDRLAAIELPAHSPGAAAVAVAVKDAFVAGYRWIMGVSALLAVASAAVAAAWLEKVPARRA